MERKIWPGQSDKFCPPTEIACIWVDKIYDACSQKECEEFFFNLQGPPTAEQVGSLTVTCNIKPGSEYFDFWTIEPIDGGPLARIKVKVCAKLDIVIQTTAVPVNFIDYCEDVCFWKEVILYAPDPVRMDVLVESVFESLACSVEIIPQSGGNCAVTATIGAFIVVKTALKVQLLVPAYGFCPVPPECEELGDLCEQFMERPFPPFFPPQLTDLQGSE